MPSHQAKSVRPIEPRRAPAGDLPLNAVDRFYLHRADHGPTPWIVHGAAVEGGADLARLRQALAATAAATPMLAARLVETGGQAFWRVPPASDAALPLDVAETGRTLDLAGCGAELAALSLRGSNPRHDAPVRCAVVQAADRFLLALMVHHALADGQGAGWMFEALIRRCDDLAFEPPHPLYRFDDFEFARESLGPHAMRKLRRGALRLVMRNVPAALHGLRRLAARRPQSIPAQGSPYFANLAVRQSTLDAVRAQALEAGVPYHLLATAAAAVAAATAEGRPLPAGYPIRFRPSQLKRLAIGNHLASSRQLTAAPGSDPVALARQMAADEPPEHELQAVCYLIHVAPRLCLGGDLWSEGLNISPPYPFPSDPATPSTVMGRKTFATTSGFAPYDGQINLYLRQDLHFERLIVSACARIQNPAGAARVDALLRAVAGAFTAGG